MTPTPSRNQIKRSPLELVVAWVVLAASVASIAVAGALASSPQLVLGAWLVAGVAWAISIRAVRGGAGSLRGILIGAIVLRALALGASPELTDDVHRYVWEGGLVGAGISPYAFAPSAPELASYREQWPATYASVGHPEVSAAYPPGMQFASAAVVALAGGPGDADGASARFALRVFFGISDLMVLVPLVLLLRRRGLDPRLCVAWAFCPLVAIEFAAAGHFDSLAIFALVLGLSAFEAGRLRAACAVLAAGILVKLLPVLALPFAARGRLLGGAVLTAAVLGTGFLAVALGLEHGSQGFLAGLTEYGVRWEAGSLVHRWIEAAFSGERDRSLGDPRVLSRAICAALLLAVLAYSWARREDPVRATGRALGAFLLLTPTLHPWYICWLVPFLALRPARSWTWLVVVCPLLYAPLPRWQTEGVWEEPSWVWPVIALPLIVLLLWEVRAARLQERTSEP